MASPLPPDLLVAANRAAVVSAVSRWLLHDLRTPLQAVTLLTELVAQSDLEFLDPSLVGTLAEGGQSLASTIERLDRLLRPLPLDRPAAPLAPADVVQAVEALYRHRRSAAPLEIDDASLRALPAVAGVEETVAHVLLVLLLNAAEAVGDREEGRIAIAGAPCGGEQRMVALSVTDAGPGLPPELGERVFEPFVTTKQGAPLAGLGLPVARLLAERMGGGLEGGTLPGGGARMVVTLPIWGKAP
jgi:signal transduction histidine kinase